MAEIPIQVPADFSTDDEVELVLWLVEDGARVELGDVVAELATAKAEVEVESPAHGVVRRAAAPGDLVQPGGVIGVVNS